MSQKTDVKGTFSFVSLGCPKNLVDSERMLGLLAQDGYVLVPDAQEADLVIINTCGFIDAAPQESLGRFREMPDGVRELNLVAQDMTYYGVDLYGRPRLAELLRALDEVEGIDWVRVLYNYPNYFTDELYETLSTSRKVLSYLDMPLQHINDRMLK